MWKPGDKTMTKREAAVVLADTVSEFVDNDYPLHELTGTDDIDPRTGRAYFKDQLEAALRTLGMTGSADKLAKMPPAGKS